MGGSESKEFNSVIDIQTRLTGRKSDLEAIIRDLERRRDEQESLTAFEDMQLDKLKLLRDKLSLDVDANRDLLLQLLVKRPS